LPALGMRGSFGCCFTSSSSYLLALSSARQAAPGAAAWCPGCCGLPADMCLAGVCRSCTGHACPAPPGVATCSCDSRAQRAWGAAAAWHLGPEASLLTSRRTCLRTRCRQHGRPCVQAPQAPGSATDDALVGQPQDTMNDPAAWLSEARLRAHPTQPDLAVL